MYRTLIFDTWGTLVDNYSIADIIEPYVGESHTAQHIAEDWRFQQKWAMFYTTLGERFVPHPGLNEACLRWALDLHHIELPDSAVSEIAAQYHKLRAYPDVIGALRTLKDVGLTLKIVANPTKRMIEDHSRFAGTLPYIDEIISSGEEARAFKPSPKVFRLGIKRAGCGNPLGHRPLLGSLCRRWARPQNGMDQPPAPARAAHWLRANLYHPKPAGAGGHYR